MNVEEFKVRLDSLAVFSDLKEDPVIRSFRTLLDTFSVSDYSSFVSALYQCGVSSFLFLIGMVIFGCIHKYPNSI